MKFRSLLLVGLFSLSLALVANAGGDNAKKLIGVWEPAKKDEKNPVSTLQFTKDGKLKLVLALGDKSVTVNCTYKVNGDDLAVELDFMGKTKKDTAKIKKLTAKEFIMDKGDGVTEEYKRKGN